jgi:hypothetical protein
VVPVHVVVDSNALRTRRAETNPESPPLAGSSLLRAVLSDPY